MKLNGALRENRRLKEVIAEKDQRLRRLLDDFERIRKAGRRAVEGLEVSGVSRGSARDASHDLEAKEATWRFEGWLFNALHLLSLCYTVRLFI